MIEVKITIAESDIMGLGTWLRSMAWDDFNLDPINPCKEITLKTSSI